MTTEELYKIAEEHLASYLRLATSHEGKSLEDDEEALMWHDKADAIADLMDDFRKAGAGLIRCQDCKWHIKSGFCDLYFADRAADEYCNRAEPKEKP